MNYQSFSMVVFICTVISTFSLSISVYLDYGLFHANLVIIASFIFLNILYFFRVLLSQIDLVVEYLSAINKNLLK